MRVRASYTQAFLAWTDALPEAERAEVFEHLSSSACEELREASPLSWIDGRVHLDVIRALHSRRGADSFRRGCAELTRRQMERPLFAPLVRGRLLHHHPERLVRRLPLAWSLVVREGGACQIEDGSSGLVIELNDLPTLVRRDDAFLDVLLGSLAGLGEACDVAMTLDVDESQRGLGLIRVTATWTPNQ